jgi:prolycopene isomerase
VCGTGAAIPGLPVSRLPFQAFAQLIFSYLVEGAFYTEGGVQKLVDALAGSLEQHGSELLLRTRVKRILVEDGRVAGVILADDRPVRAPVVVSNAAAKQTFEELVGVEHLPAPFVRNFRRLTPSVSGFLVFAATSLDLRQYDPGHQVFYHTCWDLDEAYEIGLRGGAGGMAFFLPTLVDATLAPPGQHVVTALTFRPYDIGVPWAEERERGKELLLGQLEVAFPGFRNGLQFADCATPLTLERFSLNTGGAIYGWENTLQHVGSKRPAQRTPIAGLYLAGHWTQPGPGFLRAAVSGIHTSQLVLMDAQAGDAATAFQHASLPPVA